MCWDTDPQCSLGLFGKILCLPSQIDLQQCVDCSERYWKFFIKTPFSKGSIIKNAVEYIPGISLYIKQLYHNYLLNSVHLL